MRSPCLGLAGLLLASGLGAQTPAGNFSGPTPKKDECSVAGMVVKLADGEPLRKASVDLSSMEDRQRTISTTTDASGHFQLKGLDPGRYNLTIGRNGFVTQEYGQKTPHDPGATLTLRPGQNMKDLLFRLVPSAVIAGRVFDEDGEPVRSVQVSALRQGYAGGKRELWPQTNESTNDLGEYRLFGLPPGRYLIRVTTSSSNYWGRRTIQLPANELTEQGYAPTYYPGSPDPAKAVALTVKEGEEIPSVEIMLRPVSVYTVRGRVLNMISKQSTGIMVEVEPRNARTVWFFDRSTTVADDRDGAFEIHDLLPGSYIAIAQWSEEGKRYQARQNFEVGNADVEGLNLVVSPGVAVPGQIRWEGQPSLDRGELAVYLESKDVQHGVGGATRVTGDAFTLKDVSEGEYRAEIAGISQDCFLKSVRHGSAESLDEGFTVRRGSDAALEITVSCRGARVRGAVTDTDNLPAAGVWVVLVPDDPHRSESRLYKAKTTDQYGHFELSGVAPGDYKVFSWDQVEQGAWEDPDFLKPFEEKGEKILIQEGDSKSVNLVVIRTARVDQQKP